MLLAPVRTHVVVASRLLSLSFFRGAYVHERTVGRLSGRVVNELISRCVWSIWRASFPFSTPRFPRPRTHTTPVRPFSLFPSPLSSHLSATPTFNTRAVLFILSRRFFPRLFISALRSRPSRFEALFPSVSLAFSLSALKQWRRATARAERRRLEGSALEKFTRSPAPPPFSSSSFSSLFLLLRRRALRAICILYFALAACRS